MHLVRTVHTLHESCQLQPLSIFSKPLKLLKYTFICASTNLYGHTYIIRPSYTMKTGFQRFAYTAVSAWHPQHKKATIPQVTTMLATSSINISRSVSKSALWYKIITYIPLNACSVFKCWWKIIIYTNLKKTSIIHFYHAMKSNIYTSFSELLHVNSNKVYFFLLIYHPIYICAIVTLIGGLLPLSMTGIFSVFWPHNLRWGSGYSEQWYTLTSILHTFNGCQCLNNYAYFLSVKDVEWRSG